MAGMVPHLWCHYKEAHQNPVVDDGCAGQVKHAQSVYVPQGQELQNITQWPSGALACPGQGLLQHASGQQELGAREDTGNGQSLAPTCMVSKEPVHPQLVTSQGLHDL